jgi:chorismate mutase
VAKIEDLRARIDAIDRQLVALLGERASCALAIGRLKELAGLPIYQPAREAEVLSNVRTANVGPLDDEAMVRLFERIIDEARRLERLAASVRHGDGEPPGETLESK